MSSGTGLPFEEALARAVEGAVRNVLNSTPSSRTNTSTSTGTNGTGTATTITATSTTASGPNIIHQVGTYTAVYANILILHKGRGQQHAGTKWRQQSVESNNAAFSLWWSKLFYHK